MTKKKCFIVTPIGDDGSDIRTKTDGLIASVIRPVLHELDYEAVAAHEVSDTGSITRQIVKSVLRDDLVVANLTGLNPNVMYELALRHAARHRVIQIAEKGTRLPFDILDQRTIFYQDTMAGSESLKKELSEAVSTVMNLPRDKIDNPVVDAVRDFQMETNMGELTGGDFNRAIYDELRRLRIAVTRSQPSLRPETFSTLKCSFAGTEGQLQEFSRRLQELGAGLTIRRNANGEVEISARHDGSLLVSDLVDIANDVGVQMQSGKVVGGAPPG